MVKKDGIKVFEENQNQYNTFDFDAYQEKSFDFDAYQEKCLFNREKIEKYSNIITVTLTVALVAFFIIHTKETLSFWKIFASLSLLSIGGSIENNRIYSKCPSKIVIITLIALAIFTIDNEFSIINQVLCNVKFLISTVITLLFILSGIYAIQYISVSLLSKYVFKNREISYTARITKLGKSYSKRTIYYVHFYDYTNLDNRFEIKKEEFNTWKIGDPIIAVLQPKMDMIVTKNVTRLKYFNGKTDMEIDQKKHERDVNLFGKSQKEIDDGKFEFSILKYKRSYVFIIFFLGIIEVLSNKLYINDLLKLNSNKICVTSILALIVIIFVSFKEYKMVSTNDSFCREDMYLWKDYLILRVLFYFIVIFTLIGIIITFFS